MFLRNLTLGINLVLYDYEQIFMGYILYITHSSQWLNFVQEISTTAKVSYPFDNRDYLNQNWDKGMNE